MLSFNNTTLTFTRESSSSGYEAQRVLTRKRNRLSNYLDMELVKCSACSTLFADSLKSMPCPKCGSTVGRDHAYNTYSLGYLDNIRMSTVTYALAA